MKVQFTDVGRTRRSWIAELPAPLTEEALFREVKRQVEIRSGLIDFEYESDANVGYIFAGDHVIGRFSVVAEEPPA